MKTIFIIFRLFWVTAISIFLAVTFPWPEYTTYFMFGWVVLLISANNYNLQKIRENVEKNNDDKLNKSE